MLLVKIFSFIFFFTIIIPANGQKEQKFEVVEGEEIHLKCQVDRAGYHSENLVWKTGSIVIGSGNVMSINSDRFKLDSETGTLFISRATLRDNRIFSCSDTAKTYSIFNVTVKELICNNVEDLPNGLVQYIPSEGTQNGEHKHNTMLTYQCKAGYQLIGPTTRICDSPTTKWSGKSASCKDLNVITLEKKIEDLEKQIENVLDVVNKTRSDKKSLSSELLHQYSLWEYLLYAFTSYKTHTEDTIRKLEMELDHLYGLFSRPVYRYPSRGYHRYNANHRQFYHQ